MGTCLLALVSTEASPPVQFSHERCSLCVTTEKFSRLDAAFFETTVPLLGFICPVLERGAWFVFREIFGAYRPQLLESIGRSGQ